MLNVGGSCIPQRAIIFKKTDVYLLKTCMRHNAVVSLSAGDDTRPVEV